MNGIKEQLVEELVEKAFTKEIYIVTPICYRFTDIQHQMSTYNQETYSQAFFTKEAADQYLKEFDEALCGQGSLVPHIISSCRMNGKPFDNLTIEKIVGQNNNMVRINQIWELEDPVSYLSLQDDYDDLYDKHISFLKFNSKIMWSIAGLMTIINLKNAYRDGNFKLLAGIYLIGGSICYYAPRTKLGKNIVDWIINKLHI